MSRPEPRGRGRARWPIGTTHGRGGRARRSRAGPRWSPCTRPMGGARIRDVASLWWCRGGNQEAFVRRSRSSDRRWRTGSLEADTSRSLLVCSSASLPSSNVFLFLRLRSVLSDIWSQKPEEGKRAPSPPRAWPDGQAPTPPTSGLRPTPVHPPSVPSFSPLSALPSLSHLLLDLLASHLPERHPPGS